MIISLHQYSIFEVKKTSYVLFADCPGGTAKFGILNKKGI